MPTEALKTIWMTNDQIIDLITAVKPFTMVSDQRAYALARSVEKVVRANIPGDFVECGVWAGGLCMLMANTLNLLAAEPRKIWLYDTFKGMTQPDERDRSINDGHAALDRWTVEQKDNHNEWCYASEEEVRRNLTSTSYPPQLLRFVKGDVLHTIPKQCPEKISILRLDTDWYASTAWELKHLYPKLSSGGVLIVDDFSDWSGSRQAVEEYFGDSLTNLEQTLVNGTLVIVKA